MATVYLPDRYSIRGKLFGNTIIQLGLASGNYTARISEYQDRHLGGSIVNVKDLKPILVVEKKTSSTAFENILLSETGLPSSEEICRDAKWLRPKVFNPNRMGLDDLKKRCIEVRASWENTFVFKEEEKAGKYVEPGLRHPQIGALYASLAHWKVTEDIGTVVMPTGTGKTETMLSLLIKHKPVHLLVIVPTAALRDQLSRKFLSLGLLQEFGIVSTKAAFPIVGQLKHRFEDAEKAKVFVQSCNVIVSTMAAISGCSDEVQSTIAGQCSHLFIDEAHHTPATTWSWFRQHFVAFEKPVLQFTATPFRRDGKHLGGKTIFNYPIKKAQDEGYFTPINFISLWEYGEKKGDIAVAEEAVRQLNDDLGQGFDHLIMARTNTIDRAEEILDIYKEIASEHNPIIIHSDLKATEKEKALLDLKSRKTRIITCVDMLGEGFDLPQLKIAALHDVHKSLAVTIQFIGRFSRQSKNIGEASIIANCGNIKVEEAIEDLYIKGSDWNVVIRKLSEGESKQQEIVSDFLNGFNSKPLKLPLQNIQPKMSTVAFRTKCVSWRPEKLETYFPEDQYLVLPTINPEHNVALFVTQEKSKVAWGNSKEIVDVVHNLYLLHWNDEQNVLYINSSNNSSLHISLARRIAGDDIEIINGEDVFRLLDGMNRIILTTIGLRSSYSRAAQFSMHIGTDVKSALTPAMLRERIKTNTFAYGFRGGGKASVGCAYKGRVWCHLKAKDLSEWVEWCSFVGEKLLDENISTEKILEYVIIPEPIKEKPNLVPIIIEWPEKLFIRNEENVYIEIDGDRVPFYEADIKLEVYNDTDPILFSINTDLKQSSYEVIFHDSSIDYRSRSPKEAYVVTSSKALPLSKWFQEESPIIRFENNSFLIYNFLYKPKGELDEPFEIGKVEVWDWLDVNIKTESIMKAQKKPPQLIRREESIQYKVVNELIKPENDYDFDIVFDDDGTGEIADIVAIKVRNNELHVHLYHCKYSSSAKPGARVGDLYEVCGQAQRSVIWKGSIDKLFTQLRLRENKRLEKYVITRFEKGDIDKLVELQRRSRFLEPVFKIFVVQPGFSVKEASQRQLELLSATETYLMITYAIEFGVIAQ